MGAREEGIARGGEMMSRMREEIEGMRAKLFEWNRFANLRLTHGENTMYLDAMFCAEVFGLIKTEMEAIEERMGDGGGRPAKARKLSSSGSPGSAASDAAEGAPVCHLDLAAIGLSADRADVVWDIISITYFMMKRSISDRSVIRRQTVVSMILLRRRVPQTLPVSRHGMTFRRPTISSRHSSGASYSSPAQSFGVTTNW